MTDRPDPADVQAVARAMAAIAGLSVDDIRGIIDQLYDEVCSPRFENMMPISRDTFLARAYFVVRQLERDRARRANQANQRHRRIHRIGRQPRNLED